MEEIIKKIAADDGYKAAVLTEAEKHGKSFDYQSAKFTVRETAVSYDYQNCNDSVLFEMMEQAERLAESIKLRQDFLKTIPEGGLTVVDEETGETYKVYSPIKRSTTSVAVTLR